MFWTLVKKELKNNLLSLRFLLALGVILFVMAVSAAVRVHDFRGQAQDEQANRDAEEQALRNIGWWAFEWSGTLVERPVQPLSVLVAGIERQPDTRARIYNKLRPMVHFLGTQDRNPMLMLTAPVDMLFITGIVISLLVLVLSADAVSGEREEGTLKLLLSFPVPRSTLIFAKWVGGMLTLAVPFVVGALGMAIYILLSHSIRFNGQEWGAFGLMALASLLYIAWMFSAALFVSTWFQRTASSMCMLLSLWVVLVLALPNLAPYIAAGLRPTESTATVMIKSRELGRETRVKERDAFRDTQKKFGVRRFWDTYESFSYTVEAMSTIKAESTRKIRGVIDTHRAGMAQQTQLAMRIGRISPFTCYASAIVALAWTGPDYGDHLLSSLRMHEDACQHAIVDAIRTGHDFDIRNLPAFRYRPPPLGKRFMMGLPDWIILGVETVLLFLGAYVSFVKREII